MIDNWLVKRRKELRLSQEELARQLQIAGLDYARATISHWETGRYSPPLDDPEFRRVLANALQVSIQDLLQMAGYEIDPDHSKDARRAADIVDQLPAYKRALALGLLEQLLKEG